MDRPIATVDFAAGGGAAAVDPSRSVFINCPFDPEYEPLRDALLLTVVSCGFVPRSALESGQVSVSRMERIFQAIYSSAYSIHDLSRCRGEGEQVLARFNMPLELGIAMSRRYGGERAAHHDWLVLVPTEAPYARFVSDLAGFDLPPYDGTEESLIRQVMTWLMFHPQALPGVRPSQVIARLEMFRKEKAKLKAEWGQIPWKLLVEAAVRAAGAEDKPPPG
jgi:hypothetical protein